MNGLSYKNKPKTIIGFIYFPFYTDLNKQKTHFRIPLTLFNRLLGTAKTIDVRVPFSPFTIANKHLDRLQH